jgi:hypothetical protein
MGRTQSEDIAHTRCSTLNTFTELIEAFVPFTQTRRTLTLSPPPVQRRPSMVRGPFARVSALQRRYLGSGGEVAMSGSELAPPSRSSSLRRMCMRTFVCPASHCLVLDHNMHVHGVRTGMGPQRTSTEEMQHGRGVGLEARLGR